MKIPLRQFEHYIDEEILQRGRSYFKNGHVHPPEELFAGEYEAVVEGTEDYTVRVKIKNEIVEEFSCTCPYDMGPVCKHVAAVLYYFEQENSGAPKTTGKNSSKKTVKKPTVARQIQERLDALSPDDLQRFVYDLCMTDPEVRRVLLLRFAKQSESESKEFYSKQIKSILRTAAGREGYIDWSTARRAGDAVLAMLQTAREHLDEKRYKSAVVICFAVLEEMTDALQYSDDSNGDIGGTIDEAVTILVEISSEEIPDDIRSCLFEYCTDAFRKGIFSGWGWHLGVLRLAADISRTEEEANLIISLIQKATLSEYGVEQAQEIQLSLIRKMKGKKAAYEFLEKHMANPSFRKTAIEEAFRKKNFERAISLANDGIRLDEKQKPGLAMDWLDWLLKIALAQKDKEQIVQYARRLFIDSHRDKQGYYRIMKNHLAKNKWADFVEELVKDITKRSRWLDVETIGWIYIQEQQYDKLMALVRTNPTLDHLERYEKHLHQYSGELAQLYEQCITEYLKRNMGRDHYKTACRYIRRMIKLGGRERADVLMKHLRNTYQNRSALLEELAGI